MNYEFHVGDYVETVEGKKGYLSRYQVLSDGHIVFYVQYKDEKIYPCNVREDGIKYRFARIGTYDFTKKEKKKIEPISDCNKHIFANAVKPDNQLVRTVSDDILNKINELVDAVNKLMDDYDEHIETHRQADR